MRAGLSLLETLVAVVILVLGLVPIVEAYRTGFRATGLEKDHAQALLLAQSAMEEARARVASGLTRYYQLKDTGKEILPLARAGRWKDDFLPLASGSADRVVSADRARINPYFAKLFDGGPITAALDASAARFLERFRVTVRVEFQEGGKDIDSDLDGRGETDMCEIIAEVTWDEPGRARPEPVVLRTLFTREDFDRALEANR